MKEVIAYWTDALLGMFQTAMRDILAFVVVMQEWAIAVSKATAMSIQAQLVLIESSPPTSGSIFGFSEYLASLALFLVVVSSSDFRFRFRLACDHTDLRILGSWLAALIGFFLLLTDVWFQNNLPVPKILANANNIKAVLAIVFTGFIFRVLITAFIWPPKFGPRTAEKIFQAVHQFILEGDEERMRVVAEELQRSLAIIIKFSVRQPSESHHSSDGKIESIANEIILLIADLRFCKVVVRKSPMLAILCINEFQEKSYPSKYVSHFIRNVGHEFIRDKNSAFYQEKSGFETGLLGYSRPVTNIIFGSSDVIQSCASYNRSPLDLNYGDISTFDGEQTDGYSRASISFIRAYLISRFHKHPYALNQIFECFNHALSGVYRLDGVEDINSLPEFQRFYGTIKFLRAAMDVLDDLNLAPRKLRIREKSPLEEDVFDLIAECIFAAIVAAATISGPRMVSWRVLYGSLWAPIFRFHKDRATRIVGFKLRRLVYDEIKMMEEYANFSGARVLGFFLNVFGPKVQAKGVSLDREFLGLQRIILAWYRTRFSECRKKDPKVADACVFGTISFDEVTNEIVKTYSSELGNRPSEERLKLDD